MQIIYKFNTHWLLNTCTVLCATWFEGIAQLVSFDRIKITYTLGGIFLAETTFESVCAFLAGTERGMCVQ